MMNAKRRSEEGRGDVPGSPRDPAVERAIGPNESDRDAADAMKKASPPAGAAAGAIAGGAAGLAAPVAGPVGALVGAIVGALGGTAVGTAAASAVGDVYTPEHDEHYRSTWESIQDRPVDRTFESVRPAYQFGHFAAGHPELGGRHFTEVEPELRRRWSDELRSRAGEWDAVRAYVEDGYSYARSRGLGERRDQGIIGSAGSAVDPVERDRARSGLPSTEGPIQ
jgi:hypothetical protein